MKNYPIQENELPIIYQLCHLHGLKYTHYKSLKPGWLWVTISHPDPDQELSPELCFVLGRSYEIQMQLMQLDETAHRMRIEHKVELIDTLP